LRSAFQIFLPPLASRLSCAHFLCFDVEVISITILKQRQLNEIRDDIADLQQRQNSIAGWRSARWKKA
jgi:hypothetical protein